MSNARARARSLAGGIFFRCGAKTREAAGKAGGTGVRLSYLFAPGLPGSTRPARWCQGRAKSLERDSARDRIARSLAWHRSMRKRGGF